MTLFETEDERRRRRLQGLGLNVLRDGERMRLGMMFTDSASGPGSTYLKDAPMTVSITDAIQQIPTEFQHKMRYDIGRMQDGDPFIIRQGIDSAQGLISRMGMIRDGYGGAGTGMVTDADRTNLTRCSEYLSGHIAAARQRLAEKGR